MSKLKEPLTAIFIMLIPLVMTQTLMDWGLVDDSGIVGLIKPALDNPIIYYTVQMLKYTSYMLVLVGIVLWPAIFADAHSNKE